MKRRLKRLRVPRSFSDCLPIRSGFSLPPASRAASIHPRVKRTRRRPRNDRGDARLGTARAREDAVHVPRARATTRGRRREAHAREDILGRGALRGRRSRVTVVGVRRSDTVGVARSCRARDYILYDPRGAMATTAGTTSRSTPDLIQASRPGFPRGLRVRTDAFHAFPPVAAVTPPHTRSAYRSCVPTTSCRRDQRYRLVSRRDRFRSRTSR